MGTGSEPERGGTLVRAPAARCLSPFFRFISKFRDAPAGSDMTQGQSTGSSSLFVPTDQRRGTRTSGDTIIPESGDGPFFTVHADGPSERKAIKNDPIAR